jgi:hypothetical protein
MDITLVPISHTVVMQGSVFSLKTLIHISCNEDLHLNVLNCGIACQNVNGSTRFSKFSSLVVHDGG